MFKRSHHTLSLYPAAATVSTVVNSGNVWQWKSWQIWGIVCGLPNLNQPNFTYNWYTF